VSLQSAAKSAAATSAIPWRRYLRERHVEFIHMAVAEHGVPSGLGRAGMKVIKVEQHGNRREFADTKTRERSINAVTAATSVPPITRTFRLVKAVIVCRTLEDHRTLADADGWSCVGCKHIADSVDWLWISQNSWNRLRAGQLCVVVRGVKPKGDAQLPQLAETNGIAHLDFGPVENREQQAGEQSDDGKDDKEFNQREGATRRV
jgi:hypothetical protein